MMESIALSAVAGLIAALVATGILGLARYLRQRLAKRRDIRYIRRLLIEGRKRVLESKDTPNEGMGVVLPAGALRAAQYNNMLRVVGVALDRWALHLSHDQRKDIYDALDWFGTNSLQAVKSEGDDSFQFVQLPEGKWHTTEMSMELATATFERLQSIGWLKLPTE